MLYLLFIPIIFLLLAHTYREYWARRNLPQLHFDSFEGKILRVGETYIAYRAARSSRERTIICFPGFLEDMRYFVDLYQDDEAELILINNANYHCPFPTDQATSLHWTDNPYAVGSIEYDGFYLGLVLERLASGRDVLIHGHSRGGAVVLEAGRQRPDLMVSQHRTVSALLEAPVLPQARTFGRGSEPIPHMIACYLMPIFFGHLRTISTEQLLEMPMMMPTTPLKTRLCRSVFSTARSYTTCVRNVQSIVRWQRDAGFDLYDNFFEAKVLVGERDTTLDRASMVASAEQGRERNSGVAIIETSGTNHFICLERPEVVRGVAEQTAEMVT